MIDAPGFRKLVTSLYPEGDEEFLSSGAVFGVKKSLAVVSVTGSSRPILRNESFSGRNSLKWMMRQWRGSVDSQRAPLPHQVQTAQV